MKKIAAVLTIACLVIGYIVLPKTQAVTVTAEPSLVGVTYYGGNWDEKKKSWIIDNADQCTRIRTGEFTERSLDGIMSQTCNDDNGEGFAEGTKLHNRVSFAELSNIPDSKDFSALGNLPLGSRVEISYQGKCLVAEKLDVGQGGGPVNGYQRSLDLWWQTARSLDFKNGFDVMSVRRVPDNTPLTELGKSYDCIQNTSDTVADTSKATDPNSQPAAKGDSSETIAPNQQSNDNRMLVIAIATGMILFSALAFLGLLRHIKK